MVAKIASLNVNGLRSHLDEVRLLVKDLGIHILALNEAKLDSSIPKELTEISGFQQKRRDRSRNGGGVSLYVKDTFKMAARDDVPADGLELLCIEISPPKVNPSLLLLGTDHPVTLLTLSVNWKRLLPILTRRAKKLFSLATQTVTLPKSQLISHWTIMQNTFVISMSCSVSDSILRSQLGSLLARPLSLTTLLQHVPGTLSNQECMKSH